MNYLFYACAVPSRRSTLSISRAMEMCYSELSSCWCCCLVVCQVMVLAVCACVALVVVDRAVEPVERAMCLNATIASLSRHDRDAEHDPFSRVVVFFFCYLLEDRAFEPVGEVVARLTISIVGSSCRDHDAERNSFPRV
jgi:hypothetical protein